MSKNGSFTISLDFELYWGMRDLIAIEKYADNIRNVKVAIPAILDLFTRYEIHATWAVVGFLFAKNKKELLPYLPDESPGYEQKKYDPYEYIQHDALDPQDHFAPGLIALISSTPHQEIGTHTFSHYYTLEKGQTSTQFLKDLEAAKAIHSPSLPAIHSIVFPRNQYNQGTLQVVKDVGIKCYRGNPEYWLYQPRIFQNENILIRILRITDAYINISGKNSFVITHDASGLVNVPASRFLRPISPGLKWLENLRFKRIERSMTYAAKNKENYHLWWHPHNFGKNISENIRFLERILQHYKFLQEQYGFQSRSMGEYQTNH